MNTNDEMSQILWNDMKNLARETCDQAIVPWLDRLNPISFENNVLTVSTKQKWTVMKIISDYKQTIERLLRNITLENVILNIELDTTGQQDTTINHAPQPYIDNNSGNAGTSLTNTSYVRGMSPAELAGIQNRVDSIDTDKLMVPVNEPYTAPSIKPISNIESTHTMMGDSQGSFLISGEHKDSDYQESSQVGESTYSISQANRTSEFTFDNYVVGEANSLAFEYARDVAIQPSGVVNPLFIYGPSGYGKTHLLYAIINYVDTHQGGAYKVLYVSATMFVEQFVEEIRVKRIHGESVMKQYRDVDILLVDDVQQFSNKQQESMVMFFDLFNKLVLQGKQIVLAADRAPDYLNLDARMKTRFGQGLVVDIKAPTYEMKRSILKNLYLRSPLKKSLRVEIPDDVFDIIAQIGPENPRSMQGFITSLIPEANQNPSVLTYEGIKEFNNKLHKASFTVNISTIAKTVADHYGVAVEDLQSKSRTKNVSEARQVVMWMTRQLTDYTHEEIGKFLGDRDHATVSYGVRETEKRSADRGYATMLNQLKKSITE